MKKKYLKMIAVSMTAAAVCMTLIGCGENTESPVSQSEGSGLGSLTDTTDASIEMTEKETEAEADTEETTDSGKNEMNPVDIIDPTIYTPYDGWEANTTISFAPQWYEIGDSLTVRSGGINKLDGITCSTQEDIFALEEELRNSDYILVNTDNMEISEEEYQLLSQTTTGFTDYIQRDNLYYWQLFKVYLYRPVYDEMIAQLRENGRIDSLLGRAESTSTVVANFGTVYHKQRADQIINEYNDMIPSWDSTGFLLVESPIDACITMKYTSGNYFCELYVKANEPFLVKTKQGGYYITSINAVDIAVEEETLMYNNTVNISIDHTETEPIVLSIEKVVEKYDIAPLENIEEKPDYSWNS